MRRFHGYVIDQIKIDSIYSFYMMNIPNMRTNRRVSPFHEKVLVGDKKPYRHEFVCQYLIQNDEEHGFTYRFRFLYRITYTPKSTCFRRLTFYTKILGPWETVSLGFNDFNLYIKNRFDMRSTEYCKRIDSSLRTRQLVCGIVCVGILIFLLI